MSTFKFDNHGELQTGLTRITNTSSEPEHVYNREEIEQTWANLKDMMGPVLQGFAKLWDEIRQNRKLMEKILEVQAIDEGSRYWHDTTGQPRRNPTMRPLIHNGKAYRK